MGPAPEPARRHRAVFPPGARERARGRAAARADAPGVGASQGLGDGAPHDGHRVSRPRPAAAARRRADPARRLPACTPPARPAAQAAFATAPNQVWQLDFSEFETTTGGTWRITACRDYWSKYEHPWHVSPTTNQHDAFAAIELALTGYQAVFGRPLIEACARDADGNVIPAVTIVTDNGGPFRSFRFEASITAHRAVTRAHPVQDPRTERVTRTRLSVPDARTALT